MDRASLMRRRLGPLLCGVVLGAWSVHSWAALPATGAGWGEPGLTFKSAIGGTVQVSGPFSSWPAENTGTGGVTVKATHNLKLPGAAATSIGVGKLVSSANLAAAVRVAGLVSGFGTALALTGLVYEGLQLLDGVWMKPGEYDPTNPAAGADGLPYGTIPSCNEKTRRFLTTSVQAPWAVWGVVPTAEKDSLVASGLWDWNSNCNDFHRVKLKSSIWSPTELAGAPASNAEAETILKGALEADPSKAAAVADTVSEFVPLSQWVKGPAVGSGPATIDGSSTTTTTMTPAGTETAVQQRTYNLAYVGDTVNITETTVTTTTHADSSVTTVTNETELPTGGGDEPPPAEQVDLCAEHPDASGCQPLGENDQDFELPDEERNVALSSELSAAGSCPAAESLSILGQSYDLQWTPLCDLATGVRPVVIALSWLSAGAFVFAIGRGGA